MRLIFFLALTPLMTEAANYSATRTTIDSVEVIRLADAATKTEVLIAPSIGNNAYEMTVNGKRVLYSPHKTVAEFEAKRGSLGNPFLAPWANRLDPAGFYANGKKYNFDTEMKNLRRDANGHPIHGLITYLPWNVESLKDGAGFAEAVSRFEYWRQPDLMAHFPFAHTIDMIYRLKDGVLEVETVIENFSTEPMPVAIGYHPYFQVNDAPRDQWKVHLAAKDQFILTKTLVPTGEVKPVAFADSQSLAGVQLDDVFGNLVRDAEGLAEFWVQGTKEKVSVIFGPKYKSAVVYAPPGRDFVCFEPMVAPTNAMNLAHEGKYSELQSVPPGGKWRESFWIKPSGF